MSYNKFMYCVVGALGNTHDARMLRNSAIYQKIVTGHAIPDRVIDLGKHGKIPFVTAGDNAFPEHAWLIKVFREDTSDRRQKYFNKKLCSARVVCENPYGMLNGRFRILYKKTESTFIVRSVETLAERDGRW